MTPFIQQQERNNDLHEQPKVGTTDDLPSFDFDYISSKTIVNHNGGAIFEDDDDFGLSKIKDKKLIFIGLGSAILVLASALIYFLTREKMVDIEELPVIKADYQPIKERIEFPKASRREDKKIYTYITAADDNESSRLKPAETEPISIKEVNKSKLTDADKKMILKAFEDLAPNAKRRTRSTQNDLHRSETSERNTPAINNTSRTNLLRREVKVQPNNLVEISSAGHKTPQQNFSQHIAKTPKKVVNNKVQAAKKKSEALNFLIQEYDSTPKTSKTGGKTVKSGYPQIKQNIASTNSGIYVQIASLATKNEANAEYNRIRRSHTILNKFSYKIVSAKIGNSDRYRIMIGPFSSKQIASRAVQEMRADGLRPLW